MNDAQEILKKANLSEKLAEIYLVVAKNGEQTVPEIEAKTPLSRTIVYEVLAELLVMNLVEYEKRGRVAYYRPTHPTKLHALVEDRKQEVSLLEAEMNELVTTLSGAYNLHQHKPGVRYLEGVEGFREALMTSLTATEEIYTYADIEAVYTYAHDANAEYVKQRRKNGLQKKILALDTPGSRELLAKSEGSLTDIRFLPDSIQSFQTGMQIFNNTIIYTTLRDENISATIIEDPHIYKLHRELFELDWENASPILAH